MNKFFTLNLIVILFLINGVFAYDVAYIVGNNNVDLKIINILNKTSYSYKIIDNSDIPNIDFSKYELILISDGSISNYKYLPVGDVKSLILNGKSSYLDYWGISDYSNIFSSNGYLKGKIVNNSILTKNLINPFNFYNKTNLKIYNLPKPYKKNAPGLKGIVLNNLNDKIVVGIINSGEELYGGRISNEKVLFFGIKDTEYWTNYSEELFKNSLKFLIGEDKDGDGYYNDVDCNDNDASIHPNANDVFKNCVNDAPIVENIKKIVVNETDEVRIIINATDPENDSLFYFINDTRFSLNKNVFSWKTGYEDSGVYYFNVTVSDRIFNVSKIIEVEVNNKNRAPNCSKIPDLIWNEDENISLNLSKYCSDADGDYFEIGLNETSNNTNIILTKIEGKIFYFSVKKDWFGEDWIKFLVSDGKDSSLTNKVKLKVLPVNDKPKFLKNIENLSWKEDNNFVDALNLNNYFYDVDSSLLFNVSGNSNIEVKINNGIASFYPKHNWFGNETIIFTASDEEYEVSSNKIRLSIADVNEAPEFGIMNCSSKISEDVEGKCVLNASDFEGDEFGFGVIEGKNMNCWIENNELHYISEKDFNGNGSCLVKVSDEFGGTNKRFNFEILPVNDAPIINGFYPSENLIVPENKIKKFYINASDVDSEINITWFIDDVKMGSGKYFYFNESVGDYILKSVVSDGEYNLDKSWIISVRNYSYFNCSEIGGYFLNKSKDICLGNLWNTNDGYCCSSQPLEKPPEFSDIDKCTNLSSKIEINIKNPKDNDKFEIGDEINFKTEIKNNLDEYLNLDGKAYLYDLSNDEVVKEIDKKINIGKNRIKTIGFEFNPKINEEGDYALFVEFISDDYCNQNYIRINIKRKKHNVIIKNITLPNNEIYCGDEIYFDSKLENLGSKDEDVYLKVIGNGINFKSKKFKIQKYGEKNTITKQIKIKIPKNLKGNNSLKFEVYFNNGKNKNSFLKKIAIKECKKLNESSNKIDLVTLKGNKTESQNPAESDLNIYLILGFGVIVIILIISILFFL